MEKLQHNDFNEYNESDSVACIATYGRERMKKRVKLSTLCEKCSHSTLWNADLFHLIVVKHVLITK